MTLSVKNYYHGWKTELNRYMFRIAKEHLKNSKMKFLPHLTHSLYNGWRCFVIFLSSIIHAFFPMFLKQHAARSIVKIYNEMKQHAHLRKMMKEEEDENKST